MERLTKRYGNGQVTLDAEQFTYTQETIDSEINSFEPFKAVVEKLAEYEEEQC